MKNRKKTEEFILSYIAKITPGGENVNRYKDFFGGLNDKEFNSFMLDLKKGVYTLPVIVPNTSKIKLSVEKNIKIAKSLGYEFLQPLIIKGDRGMSEYKTPLTYMVVSLPLRRAAQLLTKKISLPKDDKVIDLSTGQVTGESKGSKLTMPEVQVLAGMGFDKSLKELMNIRGGDLGSKRALSNLLYKQGSAKQSVIKEYSTGVVSTKTLATYFKSSHLRPINLESNE